MRFRFIFWVGMDMADVFGLTGGGINMDWGFDDG